MSVLECDVAIIGAGTAGLAAERNARRHGAHTMLIDPYFSGTVCATVGCMPSKLLIAAARSAERARQADEFGVMVGEVQIDGPAVMERLRYHRDRFARATRKSFADLPDGTCIEGRAKFTGPSTLSLDNGDQIEAKAIVIATGSAPSVPEPYEGLGDRVLTNQTIFELEDLPESLAVIGGGVIGVELAQAMARLGVRVSLFDAETRLAQVRHDGVHDALKSALMEDLDLHLGVTPSPEEADEGIRLSWNNQSEVFDRVLVATGRPPSMDGLNLEVTGLTLDDQGMPKINPDTMQCEHGAIFVAGDANAARPVLHEASDEGGIAGLNAAAHPAVIQSARSVVLTVTFTEPALVSVGTGPDDVDFSAIADYSSQGRATVEGENQGLAVLYASAPDGCLVGADLCCPGAEHLGHLIAWAVTKEMTAHDLLSMPIYHPTLEEGLKPALQEICKAAEVSIRNDRDTGVPSGG